MQDQAVPEKDKDVVAEEPDAAVSLDQIELVVDGEEKDLNNSKARRPEPVSTTDVRKENEEKEE